MRECESYVYILEKKKLEGRKKRLIKSQGKKNKIKSSN